MSPGGLTCPHHVTPDTACVRLLDGQAFVLVYPSSPAQVLAHSRHFECMCVLLFLFELWWGGNDKTIILSSIRKELKVLMPSWGQCQLNRIHSSQFHQKRSLLKDVRELMKSPDQRTSLRREHSLKRCSNDSVGCSSGHCH